MAKTNPISKLIILIFAALISGAFIEAITEIVKQSILSMKLMWAGLVILFMIVDVTIYAKTGEEIIFWLLEKIGLKK